MYLKKPLNYRLDSFIKKRRYMSKRTIGKYVFITFAEVRFKSQRGPLEGLVVHIITAETQEEFYNTYTFG